MSSHKLNGHIGASLTWAFLCRLQPLLTALQYKRYAAVWKRAFSFLFEWRLDLYSFSKKEFPSWRRPKRKYPVLNCLSSWRAYKAHILPSKLTSFVMPFNFWCLCSIWSWWWTLDIFVLVFKGDPIVLGFTSSSPLYIRYNLQNKTDVVFFRDLGWHHLVSFGWHEALHLLRLVHMTSSKCEF